MAIDREYVLAGLVGLLLDNVPTDTFTAKYAVLPREMRRAVCVAIQATMQGGRIAGDQAVARVKELARQIGFTKDELTSMAWEVLRGALHDKEADVQEIAYHVLKYFLIDKLPQGTRFGYTGMRDEFQPRDATDSRSSLMWDLVTRDLLDTDVTALSTELQELLRDVGLLTTNP